MFLVQMSENRAESRRSDRVDRRLDEAVRSERPRLRNFIRKRVGNEADVEDILQDVFYQLLSSYSVTEPIEKLTSWLFTAARNRIIDWYRKKRHVLQPFSPEVEGDEAPLNLEEILFDPSQNADDVYARSVVWEELSSALEELPENQREVFVMNELDGMTFREIAEMTGEPINTLLSRKRAAVLFLCERLRELYEEFEFT